MRSSGPAYGVVDIGSNSVRLVIYEGITRTALQLFNEKVICSLGQGIAKTGKLNPDGVERALKAFERFRAIAEHFKVEILDVIGTSAPREAEDGDAFLKEAGKRLGHPARLISGDEEARLAALGLLAGIPDADGIACDLGGGSLEIVRIRNGEQDQIASLPIGALRLADKAKGRPSALRSYVADALNSIEWLAEDSGTALYAIGGLWRRFARIHVATVGHPLQMLQGYTVSRMQARELATTVVERGRAFVDKTVKLPKHRAEMLPYGSVVLEQLIEVTKVEKLVFSAYGLREGLLFDRLPRKRQKGDPLIEMALEMEARHARGKGHGDEVFSWLEPVFPDAGAHQKRLHRAAAILADIGWRRHMDYRPQDATNSVLTGQFAGVDHRDRAFLALATWYRYTTSEPKKTLKSICYLLSEQDRAEAEQLGAAIRLAFALTAGTTDTLKDTGLTVSDTQITLHLAPPAHGLQGEKLSQRLNGLAARQGKKGQVELID